MARAGGRGRPLLTPEERRALREARHVEEGRPPTPWSLSDRHIGDEAWTDVVVHEGVTVDRVDVRSFRWTASAVLRRCAFRDVTFDRVALTGLRFEDVTFERCTFDTIALTDCAFVRCSFTGGSLAFVHARGTLLSRCSLDDVRAESWTLNDCILEGVTVEGSALRAIKAGRCTITLEMEGGELRASELTACTIVGARFEDVALGGVRVLGGAVESAAFVAARGGNVAFAGSDIGTLSLRDCSALSNVRVTASRLGALDVERCSCVRGLALVRSELHDLSVTSSTLQDATFDELVASGVSRIERSAIVGAFFRAGTFADIRLDEVVFEEYFAVEGARFERIEPRHTRRGAGLRPRLEGDGYGDGSPTWRHVLGT